MKIRIGCLCVTCCLLPLLAQDPMAPVEAVTLPAEVPAIEPVEAAEAVELPALVVESPAEPTPTPVPEPVAAPEPPADAFPVTVLGDRVNLRTESTLDSDVVGQAGYGEVLQALSMTDAWVEIVPPASVSIWVYSPLLFEDREVRAREMNVRSGPGTQFSRLGQLTRGAPVTVIESLGDWRKVHPPEGITLWISRQFVQVPAAAQAQAVAEVAEPEPTPLPVPTPVTIVEVRTVERIVEVPVPATPTPAPQVIAPEGLDLVPLRGQGTASRRRGVVKAYILAAGSPSRFRLERADGTPLCYLVGQDEVLQASAGTIVLVAGRDFWVTGERLPVTQVQTVKPLGEERLP